MPPLSAAPPQTSPPSETGERGCVALRTGRMPVPRAVVRAESLDVGSAGVRGWWRGRPRREGWRARDASNGLHETCGIRNTPRNETRTALRKRRKPRRQRSGLGTLATSTQHTAGMGVRQGLFGEWKEKGNAECGMGSAEWRMEATLDCRFWILECGMGDAGRGEVGGGGWGGGSARARGKAGGVCRGLETRGSDLSVTPSWPSSVRSCRAPFRGT